MKLLRLLDYLCSIALAMRFRFGSHAIASVVSEASIVFRSQWSVSIRCLIYAISS